MGHGSGRSQRLHTGVFLSDCLFSIFAWSLVIAAGSTSFELSFESPCTWCVFITKVTRKQREESAFTSAPGHLPLCHCFCPLREWHSGRSNLWDCGIAYSLTCLILQLCVELDLTCSRHPSLLGCATNELVWEKGPVL